jgi:hypothetical protein
LSVPIGRSRFGHPNACGQKCDHPTFDTRKHWVENSTLLA